MTICLFKLKSTVEIPKQCVKSAGRPIADFEQVNAGVISQNAIY